MRGRSFAPTMWVVAAAATAAGMVAGLAVSGFAAGDAPRGPAAANGAAAGPPATCVDGAADLGETYYPGIGNGGYDVAHYDLNLAYDPASKILHGKTTITAATTQNLCRFDLDLRGLTVSSVTVDHQKADFTRHGRELVITPNQPLRAGAGFVAEIDYSGDPGPAPVDADGFIDGWNATENGSYTADPPQGADTWFPCNNTTNDKATFTTRVTVPAGLQVMSNGQLIDQRVNPGQKTSTWVWDETEQMATYLATVNIRQVHHLAQQDSLGDPDHRRHPARSAQ